jgi:hypothetical protein
LGLCTYQRFNFDGPFTKSFYLVTNNDKSVIGNDGGSAAIPPGEHPSPCVPKTKKNDKVTKKISKKEATTSVKQLKAHTVKEESEEEGDDIQEVEQEDVEKGGPTALSLRRVSSTSSAVPELVLRTLMMKTHVMRRARLVLRNLKSSGMLLAHTSFSVRFLSEPSLVKAWRRLA